MKVIDLLNKIANGEEVPKKIATEEETYEYIPIACDYKTKDGVGLMDYWLFKNFTFGSNGNYLNYEVEIIEEDKEIEEIKINLKSTRPYTEQIEEKLNELIREVNKLKNKE